MYYAPSESTVDGQLYLTSVYTQKINNKKFDLNEYPEKTNKDKGICSNNNSIDCDNDDDCDDIGECNKLNKILMQLKLVCLHKNPLILFLIVN